MGERVRVVRHDGRLLAAKEPGESGARGLRAEAEVLHRVQVPGVVELVGLSDGDHPTLLTRWVGPRSAADLPLPVSPERAAAITLAVAATVGRLHRAGIVHGDLDPTHVLLDADGRPVLCGFGGAGPIGAPERRPATDPGPGGDVPARPSRRPADDVAGLGRLLEHLLGPVGCPEPGGRLGWSSRRAASRRRALRALAARAHAPDPDARPSVTAFAHSIRRLVPDAQLGGEARPATAPPRPSRARPATRPVDPAHGAAPRRSPALRSAIPVVLVLGAVSAAGYFGLSAWWAPARERTAVADTRPTPGAPTTTTGRPTPVPSTRPTTTTTTTTALLEVAPVVEHDGRRYAIGAPGDVVLVGPWRCDGRPLPAVVHPADGTVHVFGEWAPSGGSVRATAVATVPGADGLRAVGVSADCADLLVTGSGRDLTTLTAEDLR